MQLRTASLDIELYDPNTYKGWKNPKLEKLGDNVKNIYDKKKAGQVIFCDRVFSSDGNFNVHDKIKNSLVEKGFKENEIVIINGFTKGAGKKSDSVLEKEVSEAVEKFNRGVYKVIIGSTACIGEGLNLQENSAAVHHFDIPYRPSDYIQRNGRVDRQGNKQQDVELHTYLTAGTMDNYSVQLVQNKANWIDKLLKTKSNIFLNPDDDSYVDPDELLLALTEEWGDTEKAAERRIELANRKEQAEKQYHNDKRVEFIEAYAMTKGTVLNYEGDKSSLKYTSRIEKLNNIRKSLMGNPSFDKNDADIFDDKKSFLYAKKADRIIRKGDFIEQQNRIYEVKDFDFKKRKAIATNAVDKTHSFRFSVPNMKINENTTHCYGDNINGHIPKPDAETIKAVASLKSDEFYKTESIKLKETLYPIFLNENQKNDDCLFFRENYQKNEIENKYDYCLDIKKASEFSDYCLNPFNKENFSVIKKHILQDTISISHIDSDELLKSKAANYFKTNIPHVYKVFELKRDKDLFPIPENKNTGENFGKNLKYLLAQDAYKGDPQKAASMLFKCASKENLEAINSMLKKSGCISKETTENYIRNIASAALPKKQKEKEYIREIA
jgi:hypothetical protein